MCMLHFWRILKEKRLGHKRIGVSRIVNRKHHRMIFETGDCAEAADKRTLESCMSNSRGSLRVRNPQPEADSGQSRDPSDKLGCDRDVVWKGSAIPPSGHVPANSRFQRRFTWRP